LNGHLYRYSIRNALEEECDSFHPHFLLTSFAYPDGVGVSPEAKRLGLPYVAIVRGSDIDLYSKMPVRWRAIVRSLHYASLIVARSQALADIVVDAGIPRERVHVVYNGVNHQLFFPRDRTVAAGELGLPADRRRIAFVGSLDPVKSIPTLLKAFERLIQNGDAETDLYLIGEGSERKSLQALVSDLRISGRVYLLGERSHISVPTWIAACDLLCLPSVSEGIPNVILEAFACGRPVVASRVCGIPEIHPGDSMGGLFEVNDVEMLTTQLRRTLDRTWQPDLISQYAQRFSWDNNARTIAQLIERALEGHPPAVST
jgi:glycosyltransferase involved in cell wall biosynthesis